MTSPRPLSNSVSRAVRGVGRAATWILIITVVVFLVTRIVNDASNLSEGVLPAVGEFDRRYAENPVLAYLHIVPGAVYLLGAPLRWSWG